MTTDNTSTNTNTVMEKEIRLTARDVKYKITVRMNFDNVTEDSLHSWAFADRIIAMQRVLRECTPETLTELSENGYDVHALKAHEKPQNAAEIIAATKASIATMTPEQKNALLEALMAEG